MFDNIGVKIKVVASVMCWLGIAVFFILGIALLCEAEYDVEYIFGVVVMIVGPIASWLGSFLLYGYGELIDETSGIHNILREKFNEQAQGDKKR